MRLAKEARRWTEAERLQRVCVAWDRRRAARYEGPAAPNDDAGRHALRTLAVSLEQLGHIQREQGQPDCMAAYQEAIALCQRIGDRPEEAVLAFNLGRAYTELPALRDLAAAAGWYRRSLELHESRDQLWRAKCLG